MPQTPRVQIGTYNGVPILGVAEQSWSLTSGTQPYTATFDIPSALFSTVFAGGGAAQPYDLIMDAGDHKRIFRFIYIIDQKPGNNPLYTRVVLADRRWLWKYPIITKRYNIRRRVGTKRRGLFQEDLQQAQVPEIQYAAYSLNPQTSNPWEATDMLKDIFLNPDGLNIPKEHIVFDGGLSSLRKLPLDNLQLNDQGDKAVARALNAIPGSAVTVDPDGRIRVYNKLDGKEINVTGQGDPKTPGSIGREIKGGGHVEFIDKRWLRPSAVDVYFVIEQELRFDFVAELSRKTITQGDVPLRMDNVAPIPDFDLLVDGIRQYFGTYIPISKLIKAWTEFIPAGAIISPQDFDADLINKAMVPGVGFWAALDFLGQLDADNPRALWSARIASLIDNYRQTFQIDSTWIDNIFTLKDYLVATIDIVNGQRAPARVFADHSYMPSRKGNLRSARAEQDCFYIVNVDGYPGEKVELGIPNAQGKVPQPSPADVQVIDADQGIIKFKYQTDPFGFRDKVLPSKVALKGFADEFEGSPVYSFRASQAGIPSAMNGVSVDGANVPKLANDQRAAVLLTAIPGAPNSKAQYYRIRITPEQVEEFLPPGAARRGLKVAKGPVREVFVGPGIETARSRWKESKRELIKKVFGIGGTLEDPIEGPGPGGVNLGTPGDDLLTAREEFAELVVNDAKQEDIQGFNAASLPSVARAVAASIYAGHHARVQGSITSAMSDKRIEGSIKEIRSYIDTAGGALCQANLPDDVEPYPFFASLPASTRNIIMKLPIPPQ